MVDLDLASLPMAKAGMLIREPANIVCQAFIDPELTTRFWFTRGSGRLEVGKRIRWDWDKYGVSTRVDVKQREPGKRILLLWGVDENPSTIEWLVSGRADGTSFVSITKSGLAGDGDSIVARAMESAAGFGLVLAGLKAYLEYGIELNLVADRFPDQLASQPATNKSLF